MDVDRRQAGKVQSGRRQPRKVQWCRRRPLTVNVDKKNLITSEFKNTFFCLVNVDHRKVQDGRHRPDGKLQAALFNWLTSTILHFSTAAFFLVDSRQPFSSRPDFFSEALTRVKHAPPNIFCIRMHSTHFKNRPL